MKKIIVLISVFLILLSCFTGCKMDAQSNEKSHLTEIETTANSKTEGKDIVSLVLSAPGEKSYYIKLKDSGNLLVDRGEKYSYHNFFYTDIDVSNFTAISLKSKDYEEVVDLVNNIGKFQGDNSNTFSKCWYVSVKVSDKVNNFCYGYSVNEQYNLLVDKLIELSLIDFKEIS